MLLFETNLSYGDPFPLHSDIAALLYSYMLILTPKVCWFYFLREFGPVFDIVVPPMFIC